MSALSRMLEDEDAFQKWIEAGHTFFNVIEGRYDAYPLSERWVSEWLRTGSYAVSADQIERLGRLRESFDCSVFGISDSNLKTRIDGQFRALVEGLSPGTHSQVGLALAPYLFTWNFRRFAEYFKRGMRFDVLDYFNRLGDFCQCQRATIQPLASLHLLDDDLEAERVREVFEGTNGKLQELGIGNREPVGTAKLLHIVAPRYFPLLDNPIAEAVGVKFGREALTCEHYLLWMERLRNWLRCYVDASRALEHRFDLSILKLVDEALYVMSSVTLKTRVRQLGI